MASEAVKFCVSVLYMMLACGCWPFGHHFDAEQNERLMHLHTPVEASIRTWRENQHRWPQLRLRLISVLQEGGVEDDTTVENYLSWASNQGVEEICFKELYVSTSAESVYHDRSVNDWSRIIKCRFRSSQTLPNDKDLSWKAACLGVRLFTGANGRAIQCA